MVSEPTTMTDREETTKTDGPSKGDGSGLRKPAMMDPSSPYFMTSADNPGVVITPVVLKGENYDEWMKAVRNVLKAKKKLGFIDGRVTQPTETDNDYDDWCAVNAMLVGWIFNTIDSSLRSSMTYMETAKELWDDLKERFSVGNDMRIYQLKSEIASCKQAGSTLSAYYNRLKGMWEELNAYSKQPTCTCGCKCGADRELASEREKEKVYQFLMGLDDAVYRTIRSNILSMVPLPNLNQTHARLMNEEIHRAVAVTIMRTLFDWQKKRRFNRWLKT